MYGRILRAAQSPIPEPRIQSSNSAGSHPACPAGMSNPGALTLACIHKHTQSRFQNWLTCQCSEACPLLQAAARLPKPDQRFSIRAQIQEFLHSRKCKSMLAGGYTLYTLACTPGRNKQMHPGSEQRSRVQLRSRQLECALASGYIPRPPLQKRH
jgi:hypothetical protein